MSSQVLCLLFLLACSLEGVLLTSDSFTDVLCDGSEGSLNNYKLTLNDSSYYQVAGRNQCLVQDVSNLTIAGGLNTTIHCERGSNGLSSTVFSFVNVSSLTIESIQFVGCGGILTETDLKYLANDSFFNFGPGQAAVLVCNHCQNLTLTNVTFSNNTGYAFVGINLYNSVLDRVQFLGKDDHRYTPADPVCNQTGYENLCTKKGALLYFVESPYNIPSSASVLVVNSTFEGNRYELFGSKDAVSDNWCVSSVFEKFISLIEENVYGPLPDVGALSIVYTQVNFEASVVVESAQFIDNHGICFGAVFVFYKTKRPDYATQTFRNCTFSNNSPTRLPNEQGGNFFGEDITIYMQYLDASGSRNERGMSIIGSRFANSTGNVKMPSISTISFPSSTGICTLYLQDISVNVSTKFLYVSGVTKSTIEVVIEDMKMKDARQFQYSLNDVTRSSGLFIFDDVHRVTINGTDEGNCYFNNILGPVFVVTSTDLYLTGEILFANIFASKGASGGAIMLKSDSMLWFKEPLNAVFCNNSAVNGGAIASIQEVKEFCVFQFYTDLVYSPSDISLININVSFDLNSAHLAGNSLYISHLYNCSLRLSPRIINHMEPELVYENTFVFLNSVNNSLLEMSCTPDQVCLCEGDADDTSRSSLNCAGNSMQVKTFDAYPGKKFSICVVAVDEIFKPVYTSMYNVLEQTYENDTHGSRLGYGEDIVQVYGYNCTHLNFTIFTNATEDSTAVISMYPYGLTNCLAIPIAIKKCPLGFKLVDGGYCDCGDLLRNNKFQCDIETCSIIPPNSTITIWFGPIPAKDNTSNDSMELLGYVSHCPNKYCKNVQNISSDDFYSICRFNRTGILCSTCQEGLSTVVGHPACLKCSNLYLLTIPLYAIAGIILVVLLFLLRLTVATGTINGLILFANLFNINTFFFFGEYSTQWLMTFISFLNLELGFPLCLYNGLTPIVSSYLGYIVPVYLWSIVLIISFLSRHFRIIARLTSRSAIPVLATIIHLSFSKLLRLVVDGLIFVTLDIDDGDRITSTYSWYFDGSVTFAKGPHLGLLFLSLISLVFFILPYTIFLTGIKLFGRFKFVNRIRPFVDAFCAPYKDKWRFWFGARLLFLVVLYITYASLRNNPYTLILIQTIGLVLFTIVQASIMPYKNTLINLLDIFFLTDAILVNIAALYDRSEAVATSVNILVSPVFLMFLAIIAYHIFLVLNAKERFKPLLPRKLMKKYQVVSDFDTSEEDPSAGGGDLNNSNERSSLNSQSHRPTITYSTIVNSPINVDHYNPGELREPLLEDSK